MDLFQADKQTFVHRSDTALDEDTLMELVGKVFETRLTLIRTRD